MQNGTFFPISPSLSLLLSNAAERRRRSNFNHTSPPYFFLFPLRLQMLHKQGALYAAIAY
jgi:hypothetical protein